jgi:hypothetical protein
MKSAAIHAAPHNANATPNSSGEPTTSATRAQAPDRMALVIAPV